MPFPEELHPEDEALFERVGRAKEARGYEAKWSRNEHPKIPPIERLFSEGLSTGLTKLADACDKEAAARVKHRMALEDLADARAHLTGVLDYLDRFPPPESSP